MKTIILKTILAISTFCISVPAFADGSMWIEELKAKSCCKTTETKEPKHKEFIIKNGDLENSETVYDLKNAKLYIRDMDNQITEQNVSGGKISFIPAYKGNYYLFFEQKSVQNEILHVTLSSLRVYNKEGNITKSLLKEVRGKTIDSKYAREPLTQLPFEIIMEKPIRKHHINCCLYSGDIAPFKIYYQGKLQKNIPLKVTMETGWVNVIKPYDDGVISFEIPRNTYAKTEKEKKYSEKMIVEAVYRVNESGVYNGQAYHTIEYTMTMPLSFGQSPLEYESKFLGFATAIGVMLVFSLGLYYNRRKKRKTPKEIWFDEK
ncbi:MAG: hypothetical protein PHE73_01400 [Sulfurovaceae bacterium]|nr:hypothetical protein [Sulfurovaceae bacterium]